MFELMRVCSRCGRKGYPSDIPEVAMCTECERERPAAKKMGDYREKVNEIKISIEHKCNIDVNLKARATEHPSLGMAFEISGVFEQVGFEFERFVDRNTFDYPAEAIASEIVYMITRDYR